MFNIMAVINRGILGGFSGKLGNVIGGSWKGIAIMKSQPLSVANPKSAGQVAQRTKFSKTVELASSLLGTVITPVWNSFASMMSGYNLFMQTNSQSAFLTNGTFVPDGLQISPTTLAPAPIDGVVVDVSSHNCTYNCSNLSGSENRLDNDIPYAILLNSAGKVIGTKTSGSTRESEGQTFNLDVTPVLGQAYTLYVFYKSADGKRVFGAAHKTVSATA